MRTHDHAIKYGAARTPPQEPGNDNNAPRFSAIRWVMAWVGLVIELLICFSIIVPLIVFVFAAFSWAVGP